MKCEVDGLRTTPKFHKTDNQGGQGFTGQNDWMRNFETDVKASSKRTCIQTPHSPGIFNFCSRHRGGDPADMPPKATKAAAESCRGACGGGSGCKNCFSVTDVPSTIQRFNVRICYRIHFSPPIEKKSETKVRDPEKKCKALLVGCFLLCVSIYISALIYN